MVIWENPSKSVVSLLKSISLGSHRVGFHIMKILLEVQHRPAHICHSNWLISCFNTFSKTNISYQTLTCRPLKTSSLLKLATASKSCASRDSYSKLNWNLWVNYENGKYGRRRVTSLSNMELCLKVVATCTGFDCLKRLLTKQGIWQSGMK